MFKNLFKKEETSSVEKLDTDILGSLIREKPDIFKKALYQNERIVLILTDITLEIKYVNNGFFSLTNYSENPVGKSLKDFVPNYIKVLPTPSSDEPIDVSIYLRDFKNKIDLCFSGSAFKINNHFCFILGKKFFKAEEFSKKIIETNREINELKQKISELQTKLKESTSKYLHKDLLTDVYNRVYLEEHLPKEIEKFKRYKIPLSLLLIDIDDFKSVNINYGRTAGDRVLKSFAKNLLETFRNVDWVVRYEEDKFIIVLSNTIYDDSLKALERVKKKIERTLFEKAFSLSIRAVAVECNELDDYESLINRAFSLLRENKMEAK